MDNFLKKNNVEFKVYEHSPALTIDDLKNDPGKFDKSPFVKNLIFKDKNSLFFLIADGDTQILDGFWPFLGTTKNKKRFAGEAELVKLGAIKGSVSVFNVFNDSEGNIKHLVFDKKLEEAEYWNFHP